MKYSILVLVFIFCVLDGICQNDLIYPKTGSIYIRKCKITDITQGNLVHYTKGSISDSVKAVTIRKDGQYINLISEKRKKKKEKSIIHEHEYYAELHKKAIVNRNLGIFMSAFGIGAGVYGIHKLNKGVTSSEAKTFYSILYIGGGVIANTGIVLWISQGIRASNNRKAMEKLKYNTKITLGVTENGIGLALAL